MINDQYKYSELTSKIIGCAVWGDHCIGSKGCGDGFAGICGGKYYHWIRKCGFFDGWTVDPLAVFAGL